MEHAGRKRAVDLLCVVESAIGIVAAEAAAIIVGDVDERTDICST